MLFNILWFAFYVLCIGLAFVVVIWVLGLLGIEVPQRIAKIVGAIIFLLILIWFLQAVLSGGHLPRPLLVLPW